MASGTLLLLLLSAFVFDISCAQTSLPLPLPNGAHNTTLSTTALVDHSRRDPFASTSEPRAVMISFFNPAKCHANQLSDYTTPAAAAFEDETLSSAGFPNGTFERFKLQVCDENLPQDTYDDSPKPNFPVVVFSPGLLTSRTLYSGLAQWVASHGYYVVMIDHPYDASVVEFPDGTLVYSAINDTSMIDLAIETRRQDTKFVLDELEKASVVSNLIPGVKEGLDVQQVAMFGHSVGGATAANAMLIDSRLKGGLDLDGSVWGPAEHQDQTRPFLIFGTGIHNKTNDSTWPNFWPHLKGWRKSLLYQNAAHMSFSDLPILLELAGFDPEDVPPGIDLAVGTVDGVRNMELLTEYVTTFLDFVLKGEDEGILNGPTPKYPEILYQF
ncbi:hypothetical protein FQN54_007646 [Arachnomyces sp. PD_36]|nr:hypothetical protein FQN54_007646 [Arachnomyces sp. PD_36]